METSKKSEKSKELKLNHYTTYDVLLKILDKGLKCSGFKNWEDKNDLELMKIYKDYAKLKTLLAVCFSCSPETIYHWEKFTNKQNNEQNNKQKKIGCCIEFNKEKLLKKIEGKYRHKEVDYIFIKQMKVGKVDVNNFPFIKRKPYRIEHEYRIIYENKEEAKECIYIENVIDCIEKITFSGKIDEDDYKKKKEELENKYNISKNKINHSTIYKNKNWIKQAKNIVSDTNFTKSKESI